MPNPFNHANLMKTHYTLRHTEQHDPRIVLQMGKSAHFMKLTSGQEPWAWNPAGLQDTHTNAFARTCARTHTHTHTHTSTVPGQITITLRSFDRQIWPWTSLGARFLKARRSTINNKSTRCRLGFFYLSPRGSANFFEDMISLWTTRVCSAVQHISWPACISKIAVVWIQKKSTVLLNLHAGLHAFPKKKKPLS